MEYVELKVWKEARSLVSEIYGSLYELETQVYLAMDLNYIELNDHKKIVVHIINCKKLLNGFINYYKTLTSKKPSTIND